MTNSSNANEHADRTEQILDAVRGIPKGNVSTYGDISPGAPRQGGRVLSLNDDPTLPWWRVVYADGTLNKGDRQRKLLLAEDVPFRPGLVRVDMRAARVSNP
jgi:alkylated DNA nucleotide flippase Atl1